MKRSSGDWTDSTLILCLFAFTLIFLVTAYRYPPQARVFPVAVSWVMLGLLVLDLLSRQETALGQAIRRTLNPGAHSPGEGPAEQQYPRKKQAVAMLWVAAVGVLPWLIGILYAVPFYIFASVKFRGRRSWFLSAAVAGGATLLIWLLFTVVLKVELYPGILAGDS